MERCQNLSFYSEIISGQLFQTFGDFLLVTLTSAAVAVVALCSCTLNCIRITRLPSPIHSNDREGFIFCRHLLWIYCSNFLLFLLHAATDAFVFHVKLNSIIFIDCRLFPVSFFFTFVFSSDSRKYIHSKTLPITGFEPETCGIGSNRSAN